MSYREFKAAKRDHILVPTKAMRYTGLIVIVFNDGKRIRLHSICGIVFENEDSLLGLWGIEDETGEKCHFIYQRGKKLLRENGYRTDNRPAEMQRAASRIEDLMRTGAIGDVKSEPLKFYHQDQVY